MRFIHSPVTGLAVAAMAAARMERHSDMQVIKIKREAAFQSLSRNQPRSRSGAPASAKPHVACASLRSAPPDPPPNTAP
jgi:hypothetical protein